MSIKRPGSLELGIGLAMLALFAVLIWTAIAAGPGGYQGALRSVNLALVLHGALSCVGLLGLACVITVQHRELRRITQGAAVVASRRASDSDQAQILNAAAQLLSVVGLLRDLLTTERETARLIYAIADRYGINVVVSQTPDHPDQRQTTP